MAKQLPGQLDLFDTLGLPPQKPTCHTCDGHKGCDNCYYGQIAEDVHIVCYDCTPKTSEWRSNGDNYCRDCGRKLK